MYDLIDRPLYLCGMMGSGKTTIGKKLAHKVSLPFIDLDREIVKKEGVSIPELFSNKGESYFRSIEKQTLLKTLQQNRLVVSLGGGALQDQQIVDELKNEGWLIFLDTPLSLLLDRLKNDKSRPMLNIKEDISPDDQLKRLLDERLPYYTQSHIIISTEKQSPDTIADLIIDKLKNYER